MNDFYKGGAMVWTLLVVGLVVVVGAVIFSRGSADNVMEKATDTAMKTAKDQGAEMVEKHKEVMMDKGKEMVEGGKEKAMDMATDTMNEAKNTAMQEGKQMVGETMKDASEKMMEKPGSYEAFATEKIAANDGAVLDFYAAWCPSCRALDKNITENLKNIPAGVAILKVDYDNSSDLKKKYGVTQQHTFVQVDKDGTMIKKWAGSPTLNDLVENIKK